MIMDKLCKQVTEKIVEELATDENNIRIKTCILDPAVRYIGDRLYPYVLTASVMVVFMLVVMGYLVLLSLRLQNLRGHL